MGRRPHTSNSSDADDAGGSASPGEYTFLDHLRQRGERRTAAAKSRADSGASLQRRGSADAAAAGPSAAVPDDALSVSEVAVLIRGLLDVHAPRPLRVVGEISNLSNRRHLYFSLKDDDSVLRCVAWETQARGFGFAPQDGMQVVATGQLQFYGPQGACQLYVSRMTPVGAGALELRLRALVEELRGLGYFDPARKKPFPILPRRVAVITSANGAAVADVKHTMAQRCPAVDLLIVDVHVQGPKAAPDIVRALDYLAAHGRRLGIEAVILTRGGGSLEDLWAFNEREVADALFRFPLPVVAAIGHEVDTTVAELVADLRGATPTQAAVRITPDRAELLTQVRAETQRLGSAVERQFTASRRLCDLLRHRLGEPETILRQARDEIRLNAASLDRAVTSRCRTAEQRVARRQTALDRLRPEAVLARRRERLEQTAGRLSHAMTARVRDEAGALRRASDALGQSWPRRSVRVQERLERVRAQLGSLNPKNVLGRGYSITRIEGGPVIRSAHEVLPGTTLETILSRGHLRSRVPADGETSPASSGSAGPAGKAGGVGPAATPTALDLGRALRALSTSDGPRPRARRRRRGGNTGGEPGSPPGDRTRQLDLFIDHLEDRPSDDRTT